MATQREIKKILEKINFVLEELSIQDAIADEKLYRVVEANTPEEFLYKNAELIDLKKLLLVEIKSLDELAKRYHGVSKMLEENMIRDKNNVKELAKKYIKEGQEVKVFTQINKNMKNERYEMVTSENLVYDKPIKKQNPKYDKYKKILPDTDLTDVRNMNDILEQMLGDRRIARIFNNQVIHKAFQEQGIDKDTELEIFSKDLYEMIEEVEKIIDPNIYNKYLQEELEINKRYINADKYLLYKIYKQQVKCENGENLTEEEKQFIAEISNIIKDIPPEEKIDLKKFNDKQFKDNRKYGIENVQNFLSRINLESGKYITEEQIKNGEVLLDETSGYEVFLKKRELKKVAEKEQNLRYLVHKNMLQRTDILNILNKIEVTKETLIQIYQDGAINLDDIEKYAKRKGLDFENIKSNIRKEKDIEFSELKAGNKEQWKLLTVEEMETYLSKILTEGKKEEIENLIQNQIITTDKLISLYKKGYCSIDIINEFVSNEEIEKNLNTEELAQKYKEIYLEKKEEKAEEYKRLIALYNILGKENSDEIIEYLEEEFSNDMLSNLYKDNAISISVLQEYGGIELVESLYYNGKIHNKDILKVIYKLDIHLDEKEIIQYYNKNIINTKNIIQLYLKGKVDLEELKKVNEHLKEANLEDDISDSELLELYKKRKNTKKKEDNILYKKYGLLFQTLKLDKMTEDKKYELEEKIISENANWLQIEDLKELYKMNIISMKTIEKYGGQKEIDNLIINGDLKTIDAKKLFSGASEEKLVQVEELLKNKQMKDIQKLIFIYTTFDNDKEMRDKLVKYLNVYATDVKGDSTGKQKKENKGNKKEVKERQTVTDPFERWRLFSLLDENYTKEYAGGYLIVSFPKLQKTVIEKMLGIKNGDVVPAYGFATFSMGTDRYEEFRNEIITKKERVDITKLRKIVKANDSMDKITHHPPRIDKDGREINSWGKRILKSLIGETLEEVYTQEEIKQIEGCLKSIEESREELR